MLQNGWVDMWSNTINCITGYTALGSLNKGYLVTNSNSTNTKPRVRWEREGGVSSNTIKMQVFVT